MSEQPDDAVERQLIWGAGQLFMLGILARFHRNYRRFQPTSDSQNPPSDHATLSELSRVIGYKMQAFLTLAGSDGAEADTAGPLGAMVLRRQIDDHLDDLHIRLLDHPPGRIAPIIPGFDRLRRAWAWDVDTHPFDEARSLAGSYRDFQEWRHEMLLMG